MILNEIVNANDSDEIFLKNIWGNCLWVLKIQDGMVEFLYKNMSAICARKQEYCKTI